MSQSVSQAVAERETAPAKPSLAKVAEDGIRGQFDRFKLVMPASLDIDRFNNLVVGLVKRDRDLIQCFATERGKTSLVLAAIECAAVGLEPNTPLKEAVILPRRNNKANTVEAQLIIEYRGIVKLARRSGELSTVYAEVVHERDEFEYDLGTEGFIRHKLYNGDEDPGELAYCYAVAKFKDGGIQFTVVPRRIVHNRHRARSDSWKSERGRAYSPWTTDPEAMWRKTAIRVLEPFLPLTAEARAAVQQEARTFEFDGDAIIGSQAYDDGDVIDVDPDTGEIVDADTDWDAQDPNDPTREQ